MRKKINTKGGKRIGSGRKKLPKTTTISFRVRIKYADYLMLFVKEWIANNKDKSFACCNSDLVNFNAEYQQCFVCDKLYKI